MALPFLPELFSPGGYGARPDLPGLGTIPGMGPDPLAGLGSAPAPEADFDPGFGETAMPDGVNPTFNPYDTGFDQPDLAQAGALPVPFTPQQTGAPLALGNLFGGLYGGENPTVDAASDQMRGERDAARAAAPMAGPRYASRDDDDDADDQPYKLPGVKQTLIERGIPALIAALAGAFGGGSAAATGMLAGSSKGLEQQRELELETAKLEAARRDRKRARRDANQQREWQRLQDRASATNSLMTRLREFEDPQAGLAWLRSTSTRETAAAMGIDVDDLGGALQPEMEAKLRKEARDRYSKTLTNLQARYKDKELPSSVLDDVAINFHGVNMTMRQLADYGGEGALGKDAEMKLAPLHPGTFEAQIEGAFKKFETATGRPPDVTEQGEIVLAERKKWMEAGRDPATAQLTQILLQGRVDAAAQARRTEAEKANHYDAAQLKTMVQLENQYNKQSIPFAAKARFFNEIRDTAPRALRTKDGKSGSPIAQTRMIFQYMKMLDEESAVRASEQRQVRDARGIPNYVLDLYWQARDGQVLNDDQILQILQEAKSSYDTAKGQHYQYAVSIAAQADRFNIDVNDVVRDYNAYGDPMGGPNDKGWPYKRPEQIDRGNRRDPSELAPSAAPGAPPAGATPAAAPPAAAASPAVDFGTAGRTGGGGLDLSRPSPADIRAGAPRPTPAPAGDMGLSPNERRAGRKTPPPTTPTVPPSKATVQAKRIVQARDGSFHYVTGVPASGGGVQARRVEKKDGRYVFADGGPDDGQPVPGY